MNAFAHFAAQLAPKARAESLSARIAVEAIAVLSGLKPAARFTVTRRSAQALARELQGCGLLCAEYAPTPAEWGYRHATVVERNAFSEHDVRIYYARSEAALDEAMNAQWAGDNIQLGRALGYPDCCIAANEYFDAAPITDLVRVARTAGQHDWRVNIFLTEMDTPGGSPFYLISHFPCHLGCQHSIAYAEQLFQVLRQHAPNFAAETEALLRMPVLLRDEIDPPAHRRYGNFGALLSGIAVGNVVLFKHWRSLRGCDDLADAGLGTAGSIVPDGDWFRILDSDGHEVKRLESARWHMVSF